MAFLGTQRGTKRVMGVLLGVWSKDSLESGRGGQQGRPFVDKWEKGDLADSSGHLGVLSAKSTLKNGSV